MSPISDSAFIGSLSKKGDKVATWEYKVKVYANSIRGLHILQGSEPCPALPRITPKPKFPLDLQATKAFVEEHDRWKMRLRYDLDAHAVALKRQKIWQQIDAQLLIAILKSTSDTLAEEILKVNRTSAAALKLIKSKYPPPVTKDKN